VDRLDEVVATGSGAEDGGLTRRHALRRLLDLATAASSAWLALPAARVSGLEPSLASSAPVSRRAARGASFLSADQKVTVSALVDLIIPTDSISPGAKAAGVADYIDFHIAHASPEEQQAWVDGLLVLDQSSKARFGGAFAALPADRQETLLAEMAGEETSPQTPAGHFFVRVKHAAAEGFYTSKIGLIDDLKYQGNTYVEAPATCDDQFSSHQESRGSHGAGAHEPGMSCHNSSGAK
jgi:hypothetical protein